MSLETHDKSERAPVVVSVGPPVDGERADVHGAQRHRSAAGLTLGVDIGGTCVKGAVYVDGKCLQTGRSGYYASPTADHLRAAIRAAVPGPMHELRRVGLCVPGVMDENRRSIALAVNVPGLVGLPLDLLVPQALGLDGQRPATTICNDAAAAAHDIYRSRPIHGRLLVLTLGTGVGAAVLDHGALLRVDGDSPGHLGQIDVTIPGTEAIGPDGGGGGLEAYIGVPALRRRYGVDSNDVIGRLNENEPAILALVRALRICHAIYRPHHIYLCGGIGTRLGRLLPMIREKVEQRLTSVAKPDWTLQCGEDDFHAARGAARLASAAAVVPTT